jgi:hypothetical protein
MTYTHAHLGHMAHPCRRAASSAADLRADSFSARELVLPGVSMKSASPSLFRPAEAFDVNRIVMQLALADHAL